MSNQVLKKKEEEERRSGVRPVKTIGKTDSPNLRSFTQQFPGTSEDKKKEPEKVSKPNDVTDAEDARTDNDRSSEPTVDSNEKPSMGYLYEAMEKVPVCVLHVDCVTTVLPQEHACTLEKAFVSCQQLLVKLSDNFFQVWIDIEELYK
ncbi:unnamed protein product [Triticum turgidum subsp. durum]|uniref:Uncharacterized protein n=1 Tax=Triticum turgidum subsp. durum TaxID=4567 RepID=A0A9R0TVN1_TRITD|nr:unnamed protein product [Triticum turgidum subsp. durum]